MNKNKTIIHNQKHLTLSDRTYIEQELLQNSSFKSIADTLHKDPTTISKEVRKNVKLIAGHCGKCHHLSTCDIRGNDIVASNCNRSSYCKNLCKKCWREYPTRTCTLYKPFKCRKVKC